MYGSRHAGESATWWLTPCRVARAGKSPLRARNTYIAVEFVEFDGGDGVSPLWLDLYSQRDHGRPVEATVEPFWTDILSDFIKFG